MTQELSITTFRYVPARPSRAASASRTVERHLDALNRELLDRLQRGGEAFVSNAVVGGRYVLRACIVNFHTSLDDVEAVPGVVSEWGVWWTPNCDARKVRLNRALKSRSVQHSACAILRRTRRSFSEAGRRTLRYY